MKEIVVLMPGSCPRGGTWGRQACPEGGQIIFFEHGHVALQIDGDDEKLNTSKNN